MTDTPTSANVNDSNDNNDHGDDDNEAVPAFSNDRRGTISSARFNLLSTMVGGGSLSLPLAFQKSGNLLLAPILLITIALLSDFCFRVLIACAPPPPPSGVAARGSSSYESIVATALGPRGNALSTVIVLLMCFFAVVAYSVLLRDMLEPISDAIFPSSSRLYRNVSMLVVVLFVTPLCSLKTITSLEKFGAAGMLAIFTVGCCVVFRSGQCVMKDAGNFDASLSLFPDSPWDILDALPIFISCFVCHYNIPLAHNDLQDPTPQRVSWWLRSTTWGAALFYWMLGLAGSMYGVCTPTGHVQGNILLDFGEHDPLLFVGRLCLAFTVSMAFPMLVIPARDIAWRNAVHYGLIGRNGRSTAPTGPSGTDLEEPLLGDNHDQDNAAMTVATDDNIPPVELLSTVPPGGDAAPLSEPSWSQRGLLAAVVFWSGAGLACCVASIEVVWDLLGSSLSILLSYLIPSAVFLVLMDHATTWKERGSRILCWFMLLAFTPIMLFSTGYAVYNTFTR